MRLLNVETLKGPAVVPVSPQEFVDHARLNGLTVDRQPDLIERELNAATQRAESYLRRSLITQTLTGVYAPEACGSATAYLMLLPRGKVQSVESITMGGETIDEALYRLEWNTVLLDQQLMGLATVEWMSGYGDEADDVPDAIREGILQYATLLYEGRTGDREAKYQASAGRTLPAGVIDLWRPFQIELSG
jgi:uncharacterized phiE125 gp8 family phage protein